MSRQEALQQFRQALKAGQKCYRECVHRGRYPYPQVLEERLRDCAVAGRVDLGVLDIPIARHKYGGAAGGVCREFHAASGSWDGVCKQVGRALRGAPGRHGHHGSHPLL